MTCKFQLLAQADLLMLLVDLLRPPEKMPDIQTRFALSRPCLESLVRASGLEDASQITEALESAAAQARTASRTEWSGEYRWLFDGSIACPINEAGYVRRDKGAILGDLCGFYRAFGWQPTDTGERPDHALVELEFLAMLLVMAACAETSEQAEVTERAMADFTRHHLSDWIGAMAHQLEISTTYPLFLAIAELIRRIWPAMVQWHRWVVDPPIPGGIGIVEEPEDPYECGAPDLVELQRDSGRNHS